MASFTRRNAWNYNGTFDNPDLLWYAKGVRVMQSRALDDPTSWWFFAAIHGQHVAANKNSVHHWSLIPGPPQVPTTPLPSQPVQAQYWNQCQHQSWFFLPWHRAYLLALEQQIRTAVKNLGGPADWALPYWNYLGPGDEYKIPPAFTAPTLPEPDGGPNPLLVTARYGPNIALLGPVYVVIDTAVPPASPNGVNARCQNNTVFTGSNGATLSPGYGGPQTGFWHSRGNSGNLEANPHNLVHVQVGGKRFQTLFSVGSQFSPQLDAGQLPQELSNEFQQKHLPLSPQAKVNVSQPGNLWWISDDKLLNPYIILESNTPGMLDVGHLQDGLMSSPGTAALDPIFYLHHANIDRLWAAWITKLGHFNPPGQDWLMGPTAAGDRKFMFPNAAGQGQTFTPGQVADYSGLAYAYDNLDGTISPQPTDELAQRLTKLGASRAGASNEQGAAMGGGEDVELLGANDGSLPIRGSGTRTTVRLDQNVLGTVFESLAAAPATLRPDRVYLHLENVRGTMDGFELNVAVNQKHVGTVALFGLQRASEMDAQHGGGGLDFTFDITDIVDNLFLATSPNADSLDVSITPDSTFADVAQITVGRVSVYRQGA